MFKIVSCRDVEKNFLGKFSILACSTACATNFLVDIVFGIPALRSWEHPL